MSQVLLKRKVLLKMNVDGRGRIKGFFLKVVEDQGIMKGLRTRTRKIGVH